MPKMTAKSWTIVPFSSASAAINPMVKEKMVKPSSKPMAPDWSVTKRQIELFTGQVLPDDKPKPSPFALDYKFRTANDLTYSLKISPDLHKCRAHSASRDEARRTEVNYCEVRFDSSISIANRRPSLERFIRTPCFALFDHLVGGRE